MGDPKRWPHAAVALLVLAAFGPYLPLPGVRTEQVAAYSLCAAGLLSLWWWRARVDGAAAAVLAPLGIALAVATVGAVAPPANLTRFDRGSTFAGLDNLALPAAVVLLAWMLAQHADPRRLTRTAARALVWCACGNAILAALSTRIDLTSWLARWWANGEAQAVAERATALGRFCGIFNQPAEAGAVYSIALVAAIWLHRNQPLRLTATAGLITVGGLLTVSKVFLLIGLPVGLWQIARAAGRSPRLGGALAATTTSVGLLAFAGMLPTWVGADYLTRLLHPTGGAAAFYTGGRLSGDSGWWPLIDAVTDVSPGFGMGAGGLAAPYDSGWVEAYVVAGLVGVACQAGVFAVLMRAALRRAADAATKRLGVGLVVILAAGSLGVPTLTANRLATLAWLFATLLLLAPPASRVCETPTALATAAH